jgi:hypothetical protein
MFAHRPYCCSDSFSLIALTLHPGYLVPHARQMCRWMKMYNYLICCSILLGIKKHSKGLWKAFEHWARYCGTNFKEPWKSLYSFQSLTKSFPQYVAKTIWVFFFCCLFFFLSPAYSNEYINNT